MIIFAYAILGLRHNKSEQRTWIMCPLSALFYMQLVARGVGVRGPGVHRPRPLLRLQREEAMKWIF